MFRHEDIRDRWAVLLCSVCPSVCSPALVLDLFPHWGQEESPDEPDWSQYELMHCLQNQCPQLVETGSFRTSWHRTQQDGCSSTQTWLLFLSLWRHFFIIKIICWLLVKNIQICPTPSRSSEISTLLLSWTLTDCFSCLTYSTFSDQLWFVINTNSNISAAPSQ